MAELMVLPQLSQPKNRALTNRPGNPVNNRQKTQRQASSPEERHPSVGSEDRLEISVSSLRAFQSASSTRGPITRTADPDLQKLADEILSSFGEETAGRVRIQAGELSRIAASFESARTSQSPVSSAGFASFSGSDTIREYLALIKALSEDDEALKRFLDMIERFIGGGSVDPYEAQDFFGYLGAQLGTQQVEQTGAFFSQLEIKIAIEINVNWDAQSVNADMMQQVQQQIQQMADPLVLDLDGDGVELTSARDGVEFDITGDGTSERSAFATTDDALLALDRNRNGSIDNGGELFGDQHGSANGFDELAKFDSNMDGLIDEHDGVYERLLLFTDKNGNGKSEAGELRTLRQEGIASIALSYLKTNRYTSGGNRISELGTFTRFDGRKGTAADALLSYVA